MVLGLLAHNFPGSPECLSDIQKNCLYALLWHCSNCAKGRPQTWVGGASSEDGAALVRSACLMLQASPALHVQVRDCSRRDSLSSLALHLFCIVLLSAAANLPLQPPVLHMSIEIMHAEPILCEACSHQIQSPAKSMCDEAYAPMHPAFRGFLIHETL